MIRTLLAAVLLSLSTSALATDFQMFFDEELLMASLDEQSPARFEYLIDLKTTNPDAYYQQLYWTAQLVFIEHDDTAFRDGAMQRWALMGLLSELADQFIEAPNSERPLVRADMLDVAAELEGLERVQAKARRVHLGKGLERLDERIRRMDAVASRRAEQKVRQALKVARGR